MKSKRTNQNESGFSGSEIESTTINTMNKISLIQRSSEKPRAKRAFSMNAEDDEEESPNSSAKKKKEDENVEDFIDLDDEAELQVNDYGDDYDEEDYS